MGGDPVVEPSGVTYLKKGEFIFFSNRIFSDLDQHREDVEYIRRFRVCLSNGYEKFEGALLDDLHAAGCEFFIYLWFNGFYQGDLGL